MKKAVISLGLIVLLSGCSGNMYEEAPDYALYDQELYENANNEEYAEIRENPFISTMEMPVSTFSADVDTASYSNVRRMLNDGYLPQADAVRIEEMVNYFDYELTLPSSGDVFGVTKEIATAPWNENHQLLMIGLRTEDIEFEETPGNNLVFLLDVSGSMGNQDKLPLLKNAIKLLIDQLRPSDRISIVVYAGAAGVVLDGADGNDQEAIIEALDSLEAGGSTAGGEGINMAYNLALKHFIEGGNNRVILGTDGDFNVGPRSQSALETLIEEKRESGVFLSVLGFGSGNLKDNTMETLADKGNGVYYYIDSMLEAQKVFVSELGASLITVAKDVKLQIEFNPMYVKGYRLIGYENRVLNYDDFNNDEKDAGDIGAGHEVIVFYEIIPVDSVEEMNNHNLTLPEDLKYDGDNYAGEFATLSVRYKHPNSDASQLFEEIIVVEHFTNNPSEDFRFASSVVEFGLLLRDSDYKYDSSYDHLLARAEEALGEDEHGYRNEFLSLVEIAKSMD